MFNPEIRERPSGATSFVYQFKVTDEMRRAIAVMPFSDKAQWSTGLPVWIAVHQEACTLQATALEYLKEEHDGVS